MINQTLILIISNTALLAIVMHKLYWVALLITYPLDAKFTPTVLPLG